VRVTEAAPALLAAFIKQLEAHGVTLPERQYIAPGTIPVWDGEQLVINLQDVQRGQPGAPVAQTTLPVPTVLAAQFSIQLVRVVPALTDGGLEMAIPEASTIGQSGVQAIGDADALMEAAIAVQEAHTATEAGMGFAIGPLMTLGPEGGCAAVMLKVTISLD
jgi:hypothetical protein